METYSWTQSLKDIIISVPVPSGTKGRDCNVCPYSHIYSLLPVCMLSGYDLALFFPSP